MIFSVVTISPIPPYKRETSVLILNSTIISFGADGSNLLIKFGLLVTFCFWIYYLGIFSFSEIGATNLSFDYSFLSLDESGSLVVSSSSKPYLTFFSLLFGVTE